MQASGARLARRVNRPDRCKHLTACAEPFEETLASTGGVHRCSACESAADRHLNAPIPFVVEGSSNDADQQAVPYKLADGVPRLSRCDGRRPALFPGRPLSLRRFDDDAPAAASEAIAAARDRQCALLNERPEGIDNQHRVLVCPCACCCVESHSIKARSAILSPTDFCEVR